MNNSIQLSAELKRKIAICKSIAEDAQEGDVNFVEISSFPLVSLYIATGAPTSEDKRKKSVHMDFRNEPNSFPTFNVHSIGPEKMGYDKYILSIDDNEVQLSLVEYTMMFTSTCKDIDAAISKYHGVKCFEDGNVSNDTTSNVFFLHVCDVMNIISCKRNNTTPVLFIKTGLLKEIKKEVSYDSIYDFIKIENREFF